MRTAKEVLSRTSTTVIHFPHFDDQALLTRGQLEQLSGPVLERTVRATRAVIRDAGLNPGQVGRVFSPDGKTLATGGTDGAVWLWDVATASQSSALVGDTGAVNSLAFGPDGDVIATASSGAGGAVLVCDASVGATLGTVATGVDGVDAVAFSPDGRTVAAGGEDHVVRLWAVG